MQICKIAFADIYRDLYTYLHQCPVNIECRGKKIKYEICNAQLIFSPNEGISIYSHPDTRAFPIKFALAEFIWIMSKSKDLGFIYLYNKAMAQYSDDGYTLYGAYGHRLANQIEECINKLIVDKHSRQAVASIYDRCDISVITKDLPCNISLQFLIRDDSLNLTVTSRSSDFMTGLPIDAFHWQLLLVLVRNQLLISYPNLQIGFVIYNITSLHVYSSDAELIENCLDLRHIDSYKHKIHIHNFETYTGISYTSHEFVEAPIEPNDSKLYNVIKLTEDSYTKIANLQEIFKNRKNKIVKNETN